MNSNNCGELRLWSDGKHAHARIDAETKAGPIVFLVSLPLALVRLRVLRALARQGRAVPQGLAASGEMVGLLGRRLALRRLARVVPRQVTRLRLKRASGRPTASATSRDASNDTDDGVVEGRGYDALLGLAPAAGVAVAATPKVLAGAKLLTAAATDPKALAKVAHIKHLAKAGSPAGKAALGVLKKAAIFRRRRAARGAVPAVAASAVRSGAARAVPVGPSSTSVPQRLASQGRRFFTNWQRGVE